jgi:hypothetical protein
MTTTGHCVRSSQRRSSQHWQKESADRMVTAVDPLEPFVTGSFGHRQG